MRAVWILVIGVATGCYRPDVNPCRVTCASDEECPSGAACGADNRCYPAGNPQGCESVVDDGGVDGLDVTPDAPDGGPPPGAFKALAVGNEFACAITADGMDVRCWGQNHSGQLGDTTYVDHASATPIDEAGPWKTVGVGSYHACAIKESGALFCWGDAAYGQIDGTQAQQSRPDPMPVPHPGSLAWDWVGGGARHTCAIDAAGAMWCWGHNDQGQLGTGAGAGVKTIATITGHEGWIAISADELRTCALKDDASGWCWGQGALGQTGANSAANSQASAVPVQIAGGHQWSSLSAGRGHTCGVTTGGQLLCFGEEQIGELGLSPGSSAIPIAAQSGSDHAIAFAGPLTTCATRTGPDRLICFGDNRAGQLASGDRDFGNQPIMVGGIGRVIAGGAGNDFACALEDSGTVMCWGVDSEGRCGDGVADARFIGAAVTGLTGTIERLTAMGDHTCALTADGRVFCWGLNADGQLGQGDLVDRATAVEVPRPGGMAWTDISAGMFHTCGVSNANLYCWGNDDDEQLGNPGGGTTMPIEIGAGTTWTRVTSGWGHTCAIDSNSERWCWGDNDSNGLGGGPGTMAREPTPIMIDNGPAGWLRLVNGYGFGCGISAGTSKELWCWGDNNQQELGRATPISSDTPLRVLDPSVDWQQIATDSNYGSACGIRAPDGSGGNLWCWGYNAAGQLGNGTPDGQTPLPPTEVGTARDWLRIDLGLDFACGISSTLELRCWGYNATHQVSGTDVLSVTSIPTTAIMPGTQFTELATGWAHTCAITSAGAVLCWGDGGAGQLGDGNKAHLVPTPVIMSPP